MNRETRPHVLDLNSTQHIRSRSSASSFDCTNGSSYPTSLMEVSPEPAFIAPAAATQIVTNNHSRFLETKNVVSFGTPTIPVTQPALLLLNQFLDYLLYSFLATARSTSLAALRLAVTLILKKRLARDAISGADEELQSYLGGTEADDIDGAKQSEVEASEWNAEKTWIRTRVRCMIYSSLGDLEEDDEAIHSPGGHMESAIGGQQFNHNGGVHGVASPAVAIWLTAILEFVGEQTLLIAGHATFTRYYALRLAATAAEEDSSRAEPVPDRPMVEELDTEKVALNPALGRIWRQWRKHVRGAGLLISSESVDQIFGGRPKSQASTVMTDATSMRLSVASDKVHKDSSAPSAPVAEALPSPHTMEQREKSVPELEPAEGKMEADTDGKNSPTPVWENIPGAVESEITEFEQGQAVDIGPWAPVYDDGRRPRSMIIFPWVVPSQFEISADARFGKRPRSLPPLDTSFTFHRLDASAEPVSSETTATDSSLIVQAAEDTRSKIDQLMDRINMVTSEQAELQKRLATDRKELLPKKVAGFSEVMISGSTERSEAIIHSDKTEAGADTDDEGKGSYEGLHSHSEGIGLAQSSKYVSPAETQYITVTPTTEQPKLVIKKNAIRPDSPESRESRASSGSLTPVAETGHIPQARKEPDFREVIVSTMDFDDDRAPTTRGRVASKASKLSPGIPPFRTSPPRSKSQSSSSSMRRIYTDCRKNSNSSSTHHAANTPPTASDWSIGGRMRLRTSSAGAEDLRPSSSMSRVVPRAIHTSGSSHSRAWPVDNGKRTDDDSSSMRSEKLLSRARTKDDRDKSFEELIQSGGTIVCTLTPDEIRDIDVPEPSPSVYKAKELAEYIRNATLEVAETGKPAASKIPASLARDARVDDTFSASSDLALFLRSTGPPLETPNPSATNTQFKASKLLGSRQRSSMQRPSMPSPSIQSPPIQSPSIQSPSIQSSSSRQLSSPTMAMSPLLALPKVDARLPIQPTTKKRLVARDASGSTGDSTSILADFFRSTLPPGGGEEAVPHRISRSVAPFRTTMDSEQLSMIGDAIQNPDKDSPFEVASIATGSYPSSMTSSTGLLKSHVRRNEEFASPKAATQRSQYNDGPPRKQNRVKDPYAIDFDDDFDLDDDLDLVIPAHGKQEDFVADLPYSSPPRHHGKQEESLADFLRNAPSPVQDVGKRIPKKASAVSLITRLSRTPSRKNSIAAPIERLSSYRPITLERHDSFDLKTPTLSSQSPRHRTHLARGGNRSVDLDSIHTIRSAPPAGSASPRPQPSRPRAVIQARDARVDQSSSTDLLVEFLRDSAPPSMGPAPERRLPSREKDDSSMSKLKSMTLRRKRKELAGVS